MRAFPPGPELELGKIKEAVSYQSGQGGLGPTTTRLLFGFLDRLLQIVGQSSIFVCAWPFSVCIFSLSKYNSLFLANLSFMTTGNAPSSHTNTTTY